MFFRIFILVTILALAACSGTQYQPRSPSLEIDVRGQAFQLRAPQGFCYEPSTLQNRRGYLDADTEFTTIDAANCALNPDQNLSQNPENSYAPAPLTHMLSLSISPAEYPLEEMVQSLSGSLLISPQNLAGGYIFQSNTTELPSLSFVSEISGMLVLQRVTIVQGNDMQQAQKLLLESQTNLSRANP